MYSIHAFNALTKYNSRTVLFHRDVLMGQLLSIDDYGEATLSHSQSNPEIGNEAIIDSNSPLLHQPTAKPVMSALLRSYSTDSHPRESSNVSNSDVLIDELYKSPRLITDNEANMIVGLVDNDKDESLLKLLTTVSGLAAYTKNQVLCC